MKIAIVTQYYAPESIRIPESLATELVSRGHSVRVITGYPNYPSGRIFDGYRMRFNDVAEVDDVELRRVPLYISHSYNALARFLNYFSFAVSAAMFGWWIRRADVVYVYATQMTPAIGPSIWRRIFRLPYVLHIQDLWPESITGSSMAGGKRSKSAIAAILNPWLRMLYRTASATIAIAPSMSEMLIDRGVPAERAHHVWNWATPEPGESGALRGVDGSDAINVVYAGNFGDHQDLETVIRAAKLVEDVPSLTLTLVGSGVAESRLKKLARELSIRNVQFVGRVPPEEMDKIHRMSDFQLVTLLDLEIFRGTIPSKFQAAISAGKPVITTVQGDVAALVQAHSVGIACAPGSPQALADGLRRASAMSAGDRTAMSGRARALYESELSRSSGVDKIERILHDVRRTTQSKDW